MIKKVLILKIKLEYFLTKIFKLIKKKFNKKLIKYHLYMFILDLTEISKTDVFKSIFYVCKNVKRFLYDF